MEKPKVKPGSPDHPDPDRDPSPTIPRRIPGEPGKPDPEHPSTAPKPDIPSPAPEVPNPSRIPKISPGEGNFLSRADRKLVSF